AAHDLHVLLRHRLLLRPCGFEGGRPVRMVKDVDDPVVPHLELSVEATSVATPLALPLAVMWIEATTLSPCSITSSRSMRCSSQVSSHSFIFRITASTPYKRLWFSSIGNHSISGWRVSRNASVSFSSAQRHRRTISTFSCDIAYSASPATTRASSWSKYRTTRQILPFLSVKRLAPSIGISTPCVLETAVTACRTST